MAKGEKEKDVLEEAMDGINDLELDVFVERFLKDWWVLALLYVQIWEKATNSMNTKNATNISYGNYLLSWSHRLLENICWQQSSTA